MAETEKTHYEILGVQPSSTKPEIDRAYLAKKAAGGVDTTALWEFERAYVTLADANLKRKYDADLKKQGIRAAKKAANANPQRELVRPRPPTQLGNGALAVAFAIMVLVFWLRVWPSVAWHFRAFAPGTTLVTQIGDKPFGEVLAYDSAYKFPNGVVTGAYKVRLHGANADSWVTKRDVNLLAKTATSEN